MKKRVGLSFCLFVFLTYCFAQVPSIGVQGDQLYCGESPMPILTQIDLNSTGGTLLPSVYVQIISGYQAGQDLLTLDGNHFNISTSWSVVEGRLSLIGPATLSEYEDALRDVKYQSSVGNFTEDKVFAINLGDANFLPATGHYYRYVSQQGISWTNARDDAAEMTFFGLQGYLATITTIEEVELTGEQSPGTGWIGASDSTTEGIWRWVTGPEEGQIFWEGGVSGGAPSNEFSFWNNGEPNNFGDEHYAHITDPSVGILGSWNDLQVNGDPPGPYHPQGYVVEFGGMPGEPDINVSGSTIIRTPKVEIDTEELCDEGTFSINLSSNTEEIIWYETPSSSAIINTGNTYQDYITSTTTYWIAAYLDGCSGGPRIPVTVTVNNSPQANSLEIVQCDDELLDGISQFNLESYIPQIIDGNSDDIIPSLETTFYMDSELTSAIPSANYINIANGQVIYASVYNPIMNCQSTSEVSLFVQTGTPNEAAIELCDDFISDGFTFFDLSLADEDILQGAPPGSVVSYYETYSEALLGINQLPTNYFNQIPFEDAVYAKVQNSVDCVGISVVHLTIKEIPLVNDFEQVYYCRELYPETILLEADVQEGIPNNFEYLWSTGETTMAIQVNESDEYSVLITKPGGCTARKVIRVLESETALVEEVTIDGFGDRSTITIMVSGSGDYEFSLGDPSGPYQDSNTFYNVTAGIQTIFIRDVKGDCGISSEDISIVGYPRFFTPNDDGQNDTWALKGYNSRFPFNGIVRIFDRQGKLLTELSESNQSWDGTYQGNKLPSSDYWFIAELVNGQKFTGHFALKR